MASLLCREGKQAIISSQEGKQDIKSKEGAIKCCKEKKILPRLMSGVTFPCDLYIIEVVGRKHVQILSQTRFEPVEMGKK